MSSGEEDFKSFAPRKVESSPDLTIKASINGRQCDAEGPTRV